MRPLLQLRHAPPALAVAVLLFAFALGTTRAASPAASAAQGDFAGFVDIGAGRRLYLECRGTGSPVVVLEAGYRSSARIWSEDLHQSGAPRTMVLAGVAVFTRVCAYDRPGTVAALNENVRQSRSDPAPMPRTALDVVADLHTLLRAAGVPAPYVLAPGCSGSGIPTVAFLSEISLAAGPPRADCRPRRATSLTVDLRIPCLPR
jgi:hypothetical protein